jgi:hypothetical protein
MNKRLGLLAPLLPLALAAGVYAQAPPPAAGQNTVSREEYDKLKQEQDALRREVQELRQQIRTERTAPAGQAQPPTAPRSAAVAQPAEAATREDVDDLEKEIKKVRDELRRNVLGTSQFVLAGDASVGFTSRKNEKSTFDAGVAPLILWRPEKNILIEAGFDIAGETDEGNNSDTSFDLTLANISFLINDNLYVGGGLFVVPFGVYHRHFDPPWINKFPDDPLPFGDGGIAPAEETGLFLGGAVPIHDMKLTYDLYVTNGPNLFTSADSAGQLNFDDFTDLNNGKAVGGRIGFLPRYNIEMGYSAMFAQTNPAGFSNTDAFLQAVDLNWRQEVDPIKGLLDIRTEWVWSHVDRATFDATGSEGFGPLSFSNNRYGGYVQVCYRPTKAGSKFVRNLELVSRYDILRSPQSAPGGDREQRLTLGIDYWITPAIVLKSAYEFDDKKTGDDENALLFQIGIGL